MPKKSKKSGAQNQNPNDDESLSPSYTQYDGKFDRICMHNILSITTIGSLLAGIVVGYSLKLAPFIPKTYWTKRRLEYMHIPIELFEQSLRSIAIPITISSIMASIGSMDMHTFRFTSWRTFVYILGTSTLATCVGAIFATAIETGHPKFHPTHPACIPITVVNRSGTVEYISNCSMDGHPCDHDQYSKDVWDDHEELRRKEALKNIPQNANISFCPHSYHAHSCLVGVDQVLDLLESFLPDTFIEAFLSKYERKVNFGSPFDESAQKFNSCEDYLSAVRRPEITEFSVTFDYLLGINYRGLITFAIVAGLAALAVPESSRPLLNLVTSLSECSIQIGTWIHWLMPCCLFPSVIANIVDGSNLSPISMPRGLVKYLAACLGAFLFYGGVCLPLLYYYYVRKSPFAFFRRLISCFLIAYGFNSSSNLVMPLIIHALEEECDIDARIVRYFLPISTNTSAQSACISSIIGLIFVAQMHSTKFDRCLILDAIFMTVVIVTISISGNGSRFFSHRTFTLLHAFDFPGEFMYYTSSIEWIV